MGMLCVQSVHDACCMHDPSAEFVKDISVLKCTATSLVFCALICAHQPFDGEACFDRLSLMSGQVVAAGNLLGG